MTRIKGSSTADLIKWISDHPVHALVSTAASVLGFLLTIVFWWTSIREPNICVYVSPTVATIVKTGQASDMRVFVKDEEIKSDVSALQLTLWNAGKAPVHGNNILSGQINLMFGRTTKIIQVNIRHRSRDVIGFQMDKKWYGDGQILCSWNIMEHNDGVILEIIYLGSPGASIHAAGQIEGQGSIWTCPQF